MNDDVHFPVNDDEHLQHHRHTRLPWGTPLCGWCARTYAPVGRVELGSGRAGVVGIWRPPLSLVDEPTTLIAVDDVDGAPMPARSARRLAALLLAAAERADLAAEQLRLWPAAAFDRGGNGDHDA